MVIEGIVINKTLVKARDLVAKLLLRNGKILSIYFYGGQGGGKHQKGSLVELGHMLTVVINPRKKYLESELSVAKEWNLKWDSAQIRKDVMAFYFMCFIFELISKIAISQELNELELEDNENVGVFNVVSNSLFYADKAIEQKTFSVIDHLCIFISKIVLQLGIVPSLASCSYCGISLEKVGAIFEPHQGGMACEECLRQKGQSFLENQLLQLELLNSYKLRAQMQLILELSYKDFLMVKNSEKSMIISLFNHLCYQFNLNPQDFKTRSMLF